MGNSFLDKNVLLAYCFTMESHHPFCDDYLANSEIDFYSTQEVLNIYPIKRRELTERFSNGILDHAAQIKRLGFDGELDPMDLQDIRNSIERNNPSKDFLKRWHENQVPQFISTRRLTERLRALARDVEEVAEKRKKMFDEKVDLWERERDYPSIREDLKEIEERKVEDLWICIDAHDLAARTDGTTELATTDLDDFIRDDRDELIKEATEIDDIIPLASSQP